MAELAAPARLASYAKYLKVAGALIVLAQWLVSKGCEETAANAEARVRRANDAMVARSLHDAELSTLNAIWGQVASNVALRDFVFARGENGDTTAQHLYHFTESLGAITSAQLDTWRALQLASVQDAGAGLEASAPGETLNNIVAAGSIAKGAYEDIGAVWNNFNAIRDSVHWRLYTKRGTSRRLTMELWDVTQKLDTVTGKYPAVVFRSTFHKTEKAHAGLVTWLDEAAKKAKANWDAMRRLSALTYIVGALLVLYAEYLTSSRG